MFKSSVKIALATFLVVAVSTISVANAQLTGSLVNVSAYYPDSLSVYNNPGNAIVSAAIEYPSGSYPSYNPTWQVDISDSQMTVTNAAGGGFPFGNATFNGFILQVISGPTILSATVDPGSGFAPVSLTVEGGNRILANYAGLDFGDATLSSIINIVAVPEPVSAVLLSLGVVIFGSLVRRR